MKPLLSHSSRCSGVRLPAAFSRTIRRRPRRCPRRRRPPPVVPAGSCSAASRSAASTQNCRQRLDSFSRPVTWPLSRGKKKRQRCDAQPLRAQRVDRLCDRTCADRPAGYEASRSALGRQTLIRTLSRTGRPLTQAARRAAPLPHLSVVTPSGRGRRSTASAVAATPPGLARTRAAADAEANFSKPKLTRRHRPCVGIRLIRTRLTLYNGAKTVRHFKVATRRPCIRRLLSLFSIVASGRTRGGTRLLAVGAGR